MNMLWKPIVNSPMSIEVPHVAASYDLESLESWKNASSSWQQSDQMDYSVWGEYSEIAKTGRFLLPYRNEALSRRFAELHTALMLQREGFTCWGGVYLFQYGSPVVKGKGNSMANTNEVRSMAPWRWPSEIQDALSFKPRNPDLVGYSEERNEWRFCEVKRRGEPVDLDQLRALAVLHLLTGAPVAVIRVTNGDRISPPSFSCDIRYKDGTTLDWIWQRD